MKTRLAVALIRLARRIDPNSCVDWHPTQRPGVVLVPQTRTCVGESGHYGYCCDYLANIWKDPRHGMKPLPRPREAPSSRDEACPARSRQIPNDSC